MYQRAIDSQTWADIRDELHTFEQSKPGVWWVSTGRHPELGCITVIEDELEDVMIMTENPLAARDPNHPTNLAAQPLSYGHGE